MTDLRDLRDRLAGLCGWEYDPENGAYDDHMNWHLGQWFRVGDPCEFQWKHPFPDGDLTALAAAWPDTAYITVEGSSSSTWIAQADFAWGDNKPVREPICVDDADTEYEARLRLTVAVMEAEQ